jgi:predicted negative regulator of RcsB-dependent stress response
MPRRRISIWFDNMAKHPTSSRVHREEHGPDDAFVASVKGIYAWGQKNSRALTIGFVVILVLAAGTVWYTSQQQRVESEAAARLNTVQQSVLSGNAELAIRDLQNYLNRFGSTQTAGQARLILAGLLLDQEQPDRALEALGDLPDDLDEPFGVAAARLRAAALEQAGQADEAVDAYEGIADGARFAYQRREALADAARVRLQSGDPDRAATLYEQVLDTFEPQEQGRAYYEMWLAEAKAQGEKGAGTTPTTVDTTAAEDTAGTD